MRRAGWGRWAAVGLLAATMAGCGGESAPDASPPTPVSTGAPTSSAPPATGPAVADCEPAALLAASDVSRPPLVSRDFYVFRFACGGGLALAVLSYQVDNPNGHVSEALFRDTGGDWVQLARSGPVLSATDLGASGVDTAALDGLRRSLGEVDSPSGSAPRQDEGPDGFLSPSRNIGCYVSARSARCDIRDRTWQSPPKTADCDLDWGHALGVGDAGPGGFRCAGDTALGAQAVLPYGSVARRGAFECRSEESGMVCVNLDTGHGIAVSRDEYRLF